MPAAVAEGELDWRAKARERQRALRYFKKLTSDERHELGDALVLGDFDWREWFDRKPTLVFLRALDDARARSLRAPRRPGAPG